MQVFFVLILLVGTGNGPLRAQFKVTHFEAYSNYTDHRCFLFNSDKPCDSLNFRDYTGKEMGQDEVICYTQEYDGVTPLQLYDRNGVAVFVDSLGNLYSFDSYNPQAKPFYLNINLRQLIRGRQNIVLECDDRDYDSLVIWAIPFENYRLGRENRKGANKVAIYYDNFVYPAKGELSPTSISKLQQGFRMIPEDGKVEDKLTLLIPVQEVGVPGSFSLYIYDLKGNILRMYTRITEEETIIYRENFMSGTYRYAVFFDPGRVEIRKGLLHFIEPPKPE